MLQSAIKINLISRRLPLAGINGLLGRVRSGLHLMFSSGIKDVEHPLCFLGIGFLIIVIVLVIRLEHQASTSLRVVSLFCRREMMATMMKKTTAFA